MPLLELTVPRGALRPHVLRSLADELTETLLRWEGVPAGNRTARQIAWCYVHEVDHLFVGGVPDGRPRYRLDVTVPSGILDADRKAGFVADATDVIVRAEGATDPGASFRVWCLTHEIPDGDWGADGRIYTRRDVIDLVVADDSEARRA